MIIALCVAEPRHRDVIPHDIIATQRIQIHARDTVHVYLAGVPPCEAAEYEREWTADDAPPAFCRWRYAAASVQLEEWWIGEASGQNACEAELA